MWYFVAFEKYNSTPVQPTRKIKYSWKRKLFWRMARKKPIFGFCIQNLVRDYFIRHTIKNSATHYFWNGGHPGCRRKCNRQLPVIQIKHKSNRNTYFAPWQSWMDDANYYIYSFRLRIYGRNFDPNMVSSTFIVSFLIDIIY